MFLIHILFYKLFYKLQDPLSSLLPAVYSYKLPPAKEVKKLNTKRFLYYYYLNFSTANIQVI